MYGSWVSKGESTWEAVRNWGSWEPSCQQAAETGRVHEPRAAACPLATSQMMTELGLPAACEASAFLVLHAELLLLRVIDSSQMLDGEKISSCRHLALMNGMTACMQRKTIAVPHEIKQCWRKLAIWLALGPLSGQER